MRNTTILDNILGLTELAELAMQEEKISKRKAIELYDKAILDTLEAGKFSSLRVIHHALFSEIYPFAGKLREVNIAKNGFRFAPLVHLEQSLVYIDNMPQSSFDKVVEKYVEMNIAHPFRDGNGRSTRIWLNVIFKKELGQVVDWSKVDKNDYLMAMERSPVKDIEIKYLLKQALTEQITDRDVYLKGIDNSYYYEGYAVYKSNEL